MAAAAVQVNAGVILTPVTSSSDIAGLGVASPVSTLNQTDLSIGYIPGVTDFGTYTTSGVTADLDSITDAWIPADVNQLGLLTYGFGSTVAIDAIVLWNNWHTSTGGIDAISGFDLFADSDADFGNGTIANLGSFVPLLHPGTGLIPSPAEVFSFSATMTPFVHFRITGTQGGQRPGINELAFQQAAQPIPEPTSLVLFGLAALGFGVHIRRRLRGHRPTQDT